MSRRRLVLVGSVAVVALVAGLRVVGSSAEGGAASAEPTTTTKTVAIERTTLVVQEALDGTLEHGDERAVVGHAQGTVSALPVEGSTVDRNDVLYEVDGKSVRLLIGERPAWRRFASGMEDGPDVRQLEENLLALGHATTRTLTVDEEFTDATTAAIKRWQDANGEEEDGVVELGEIVFLPGAVRAGTHTTPVGGRVQPGTTVLEVASVSRVVSVDLEADRRSLVNVGDKVEIELPDGGRTPGTVASVGATASEAQQGQDPTVEVIITVDDQAAVGDLDGAPVDVHVTRNRAENVLAVPISALLALVEGGYGVELVEGGATRLVGVEVGVFARGRVEVRGDGLEEGDRVVVPA